MRKKLFTIAGAALIAVMSLTACSKSSDKPAGPQYTKEKLVGTYHATKITTTSSDNNIIEQLLDPCEQDDSQILNEDMTAEYIDEGIACDPDGSEDGTWSISGDKLTITGSSTQTITILSLTEDELVGTSNSPVGTVKITFARD